MGSSPEASLSRLSKECEDTLQHDLNLALVPDTLVARPEVESLLTDMAEDRKSQLICLKTQLKSFKVEKLDSLLSETESKLAFHYDPIKLCWSSKRRKTELKPDTDDDDGDSAGITELWDPDAEYEVQSIRDVHLTEQGELLVLIKWKNWSSKTNTWEPLTNIKCYEKIVKFLDKRAFDESYITALMAYYVRNFLYSPQLNIQIICRLLGSNYSLDQCIRFGSGEKSGFREALRISDPKTLRANILKSFGSDLNFLRLIDGRESCCRHLVDLYKKTRATLPNEAPIYFENMVDSEITPNFTFIKDYILEEGIQPQLAEIGCSCSNCEENDCQSLHNDCAEQRNYTSDGRLSVWARISKGPIYECNSACQCPTTCYNRVTQRSRTAELVVFKTANARGWGLRTHTPIKAWTFVMEYLGKILPSSAAQSSEPTYQFELDFNVEQEAKYVVDAITHGNASHFINHSCNPNMVVINVWVDDLNPYKPRLAFFACRDIEKHEELTFDYHLKTDPSKLKRGMKCRCDEFNCRGRL